MGTRPEVIKMAPVITVMRSMPDIFDVKVCLTGQHVELAQKTLEYFDLDIDFNLSVMKKGQSLASLTAQLLIDLEPIVSNYEPDVILVQGDTTTAFVGALTGFYNKIAIGHVEAGLRTYDKYAPFPEEINRKLIGSVADFHFVPTKRAEQALLSEGVKKENIITTGNTVIDALFMVVEKIEQEQIVDEAIERFIKDSKQIVLITGHRRENFGKGFLDICEAIKELSIKFPQVNFVYPVHLNPNVQQPVHEILGELSNVHLIDPLGYIPFIQMMKSSHVILTDSGGVQEEAPSLGVPVLVMREVTERPEGVEAGSALLVGSDKENIVKELSRLMVDKEAWKKISGVQNPYGDGKAAKRIAEHLANI